MSIIEKIFMYLDIGIGMVSLTIFLIGILIEICWFCWQKINGAKKAREIIRFYRNNHENKKEK